MRPIELFFLLGIGVALVGSFLAVYNDCRNPEVLLLQATVLDKTESLRQREVTVRKPGCPTCPGAPLKEEVQLVPETQYQVTVELWDKGKLTQRALEVPRDVYAVVEPGATVKVRIYRGSRSGRDCQPPEILLDQPQP